MYAVSMIHQLIKDLYELCVYYTKRIECEPRQNEEMKEFATSPLNSEHDYSPISLSKSVSLHERTAIKLLPIVEELINRLVKESDPFDLTFKPRRKEEGDMRSILGFLNQNEWVYNLNIGNIMQIQPISQWDLLFVPKEEYELTRDSFLEKVSIVSVAYFCISTEQRFIIQDKSEEGWEAKQKEVESEFWHTKSLEVACTFLPSECPLLTHIMLGYKKHHAPIQYTIKEGSEYHDDLRLIKPLKGIQSSNFNPIVRITKGPDPVVISYPLSPLSKKTSKLLHPSWTSSVEEELDIPLTTVKKSQKNEEVQIETENDLKSYQSIFETLTKEESKEEIYS